MVSKKIITIEGGAIDPYVLEKYGDHPEDTDKPGTKCREKKGSITYEQAQNRFNLYYDRLNNSDSGRMRSKLLDKKYNKKNRLLLYPGEPCSERYLEPHGPSKYDMWGVDAFPEGEEVNVTSNDRVISHYYIPKEKYDTDKKYGPEITYNHLLNTLGDEGAEAFWKEKYMNRLFNQYFKYEKPPQFPKKSGISKKKIESTKIIEDPNLPEFEQALEKKREKRLSKKKSTMEKPIKLYKKPVRKTIVNQVDEEPNFIEKPEIIKFLPRKIDIESLFQQPPIPDQLQIDGAKDNFDGLSILYLSHIPKNIYTSKLNFEVLYDPQTRYIYGLPLQSDLLEQLSDQDIELLFQEHRAELLKLLIKPFYPLGRL